MSSIYDKSSLVLIPSGTKTSKVYSQKPTNGDGDFDFTRSTAATRVNADGNIEKETMNLMPYSNNFSQWSPKNGTFAQGVSDPFGGNNAWSLTATNSDPYLYLNPSVTGLVTLSVWAKGVGSSIGKDFLLISSGSSPNNSAHILTSEWVRYEGYFNCTSPVQFGFEIPNPAVVGDVVHIYGAQLEYGLVARDYIETTTTALYGGITDNVPRLDYTDSSCPALLLEPQRTNIVTQSEYFNDSAWVEQGGVSVISNNSISPEGVQNATSLAWSANDYLYYLIGDTGSQELTLSFWAKGISGETIVSRGNTAAGANQFKTHTFDGTWQRFTHTINGGVYNYVYPFDARSSFTATSMEIFGFQVEAGSYKTSYIPTYGTSVTRNIEPFNLFDIQDNNLVTSTTGTLFLHPNEYSQNAIQWSFENDSNTSGFRIRFRDSEVLIYERVSGSNVEVADVNESNTKKKLAISWNNTNLLVSVNGTTTTHTITSAAASGVQNLKRINSGSVLIPMNQILVFPTQLTEAELNDLTTI